MFTPLIDDAMMGRSQATQPVTNLAPHVDGGTNSARGGAGSNAAMDREACNTLYIACGIVLSSLLLLWLMGALVFRSARL